MDWDELGVRSKYIRDLAKCYKITLPPNEGLAKALGEADALASGTKSAAAASDANAAASAHDAHVVWALYDSLKTCIDASIDLRAHLANMGTGSTDYGTPATADSRTIFFKDFEYEVFIMAHCIRNGVKVVPAPTPNDPCYEFSANGFLIQLKHPNSRKQLKKQISKFDKCLRAKNAQGFFGVGLEDAFALGDGSNFRDKAEEMDVFGRDFLNHAHWRENVAGVFQTSTFVHSPDGDSTLRRFGNAVVFDDAVRTAKQTIAAATKLASAFNPTPVLFSKI